MSLFRILSTGLLLLSSTAPLFADNTNIVYTFYGDAPDKYFGVSVSGARDVNNDGYADVIVGANGAGGSAQVLSGANGVILYTFNGDSSTDSFGISVSGAGDVNNDGYADVIVGAPMDDNTGSNTGSARVFSGLNGGILFTRNGDGAGDNFGHSVSDAGDVNGDGYADLIVGAPYDDNAGSNSGSARIISGQNGNALYTFNGDNANDNFGHSVSNAGDVNGDGYADLIVGARYNDNNGTDSGLARVFSGVNGSILYTFNGNSAGDRFGESVSGAGDINNDGYADLIVGAPFDGNNGERSGSAVVFSGLNGSTLYTFNGDIEFAEFGSSVSDAGDVNGNGYADVIVGARADDSNNPFPGSSNIGSARIFSGLNGSILYTFYGAGGEYFGGSVSGAGDVSGDGYADVIVGHPYHGENYRWDGSAKVFSGFVDTDADAVVDENDNCPVIANSNQADVCSTFALRMKQVSGVWTSGNSGFQAEIRNQGDGQYLMAQAMETNFDPTGKTGTEMANTTAWDRVTGALTDTLPAYPDGQALPLPTIGNDSNGQWGSSNPKQPGDGGLGYFQAALMQDGSLRISDGVDTVIYTRAPNVAGSIIGTWALGTSAVNTQHFTFFPGGYYLMMDPIGDTQIPSCGGPGAEWGNYSYNSGTGLVTVYPPSHPDHDSNGCAGLWDNTDAPASVEFTVVINGNVMTAVWSDGSGTLYRINATGDTDTDGDTTPDWQDTDDDNDGMPDAWEISYGLDPLLDDAANDMDFDGFTNLQEYTNATDPTVANNSYFPDNDFNNDATADVLIRSTTWSNWRLFTMSGGVSTANSAYGAYTSAAWTLVASEDFDADNDTDILLRNTSTGAWRMFITENGAVLSDSNFGAYANIAWEVASVADYNGDGTKDVLLHSNAGGGWRVFYITNGTTTTNANMALYASGWDLKYDGDIDGDGDADIILRRASDGYWRQFTVSGGVVASNSATGLYQSLDWQPQFASDLDNDGDDDIVLRSNTGNNWRTFAVSSGAVGANSKLSMYENANWTFNHLNDVDADGDEDIVLRSNTGGWRLFLTDGLDTPANTAIGLYANSQWVKADVVDVNGDGTNDVILNNTSSGAWRAFMIEAGTVVLDTNPGLYQNVDWTLQNK